jgi:hypothetical protein
MYTLTSVAVDGENLILTLSIPLNGFDAIALQRLIDLVSPRIEAEPVPAAARRRAATA